MHARPQKPQFWPLDCRSTQEPLQLVSGGSQMSLHMPPEQTLPCAHIMPHTPQLVGSLLVSVHSPAQVTRGARQSPHTPALQPMPAGQALPQVPQLLGSAVRSTHTPPQLVPLAHT